jgi:AhpD family alkylhydroperoxidase
MRIPEYYGHVSPDGYRHLMNLQHYVSHCGLEPRLLDLIALRASQLNGCAFCLDLHTRYAVKDGETIQRLACIPAFREAPLYSARERAALAWTESLTRLSETHAPDDVFAEVRAVFNDKELVDLTMAISLINAWNRLGAGFSVEPGAVEV